MDTLNTTTKGLQAEDFACDYLEKQGLKLLIKNYYCRCGEIDLIMQDGNEVVFVEVRSRKNTFFMDPLESITLQKQKNIILTATNFLQKQRWLDTVNTRFDIIGITASNHIDWIKDAFSDEYF
jgi:putative endonuclease